MVLLFFLWLVFVVKRQKGENIVWKKWILWAKRDNFVTEGLMKGREKSLLHNPLDMCTIQLKSTVMSSLATKIAHLN